jgi:hypothetical protein
LRQTLNTSTWTPNQSTNQIKADATNELTTANGYTVNGVALASKTYVTSALVTTFDAADTSWTLSGAITFRHAPIFDDSIATPVKPLILNIDTGGDQTINGATLTMQFNASGIFTFTVS